jgi:hypothetical protein
MFKRMGPNDELVCQLTSTKWCQWWRNIVSLNRRDKDIDVQLRENNINVYYLMHNLLKLMLKHKTRIVAQIHRKYIPFETKIPNYLELDIIDNEVNVSQRCKAEFKEAKFITDNLLDNGNLRLIKKEIDKYVGEEKRYQSKLIEQNKETILDAEIAMPGIRGENGNTRIDMMNFDKKEQKIIAVELKLIGDQRLYSGEIIKQLRNYNNFMKNNPDSIARAYQNVIRVKKALGLIDTNILPDSIDKSQVESRVLLCIIGYTQDRINNYINNNLDDLKEKIKEFALGVYFFGKGGDLNMQHGKNSNNKILFKD